MDTAFTPMHRGGSGPPLVCLHGFTDTWRTWEPVLPALERRHDVLAPTLAGHAGGPALRAPVSIDTLADAVERTLDEAGVGTAHLVGNSLGGHLALQLAARGRARSVVALAPAGGWAPGDPAAAEIMEHFRVLVREARAAAPYAEAIVGTPQGRRRATAFIAEHWEHLPAQLLAHQLRGVAACEGAHELIEHALSRPWALDAERVGCPVRVVWGTSDRILEWPAAAARYQREWLPHADWVVLDGVGHCPQLDVPLECAQLVLGFSA